MEIAINGKNLIIDKNINIKEMVANHKVKSLWNGYRIKVYDKKLQSFFDNLEKNNDLLLIFKTAERQNSIYGSSFMYFDLEGEDKNIKLGLYKASPENQTVRLQGMKEFASVGIRVLTRTKTGLNIAVKECRTANDIQVVQYSGGTSNRKFLTVDVFAIKNPEIINELGKTRTTKLPYGVLSAKQFLNKDLVDFEENEILLPDTYPVEHLIIQLKEQIAYIESERDTNKTRAYGNFSNQDIVAREKPNMIGDTLQNLNRAGMVDSTLLTTYYDNFYDSASILKNSMFINTNGSNSKVEVQEGNFDLEKQIKGLNDLMELIFFGSGFDYPLSTRKGGGVKSIEEVRSQSQTTYKTIKTTNVLRKAQIEEFIERIMIAYGIDPEEFKGKWSFDIVSNILNEEQNSIESIIEMKNNGLVSNEEAIKRANPNMNDNDIATMKKLIDKEKDEQKEDIVEKEII